MRSSESFPCRDSSCDESYDMASGPVVCVPSQPTSSQLQYADLPRYNHCSVESVDATNPSFPPHNY